MKYGNTINENGLCVCVCLSVIEKFVIRICHRFFPSMGKFFDEKI